MTPGTAQQSGATEAQKKGWFSRRHETAGPHREAVAAYKKAHGSEARQMRAEIRRETREGRSPQEQLVMLDSRLGDGVGAQKERARLQKMIEEGKGK